MRNDSGENDFCIYVKSMISHNHKLLIYIGVPSAFHLLAINVMEKNTKILFSHNSLFH